MQITRVSVNVSRKVSLPEYCNVSYSIGMDADIAEGEDAFTLADTLRRDAAAYVEEQCNQALEREGQPAKFYEGELYDVILFLDNVLVTQHDVLLGFHCPAYRRLYTGHRFSGAVMIAEQEAKKRGVRLERNLTLIGETDALRAKMVALAEESGEMAIFEIARVKAGNLCAIIPLARVLFDDRFQDYHLFRDRAQIVDYVSHDWRTIELLDVQTVEELDALYSRYEDAEGEAEDGEY